MNEEEMYKLVCKNKFEELHRDIRLMLTKQDTLEQRLFYDNGGDSHQTILNRHDNWIKRTNKITAATGLAVLGIISKWIWSKLF